jgi:M6 family metalloprotease-like protein
MFNSIRPAGRVPVSLLALAIVFASLGVAQTSESLRRATPAVRRIESGDVLTRATDLNNALLRLHGEMQSAAPDGAADLRRQAATVIEQRTAVLSDLIQQDPRQALSLAFSADLLVDLAAKFPESASLLETHGTWQGPIEYWIADYPDGSHKTVRRLNLDQETVELQFTGPEPAGLTSGSLLVAEGVRLGNVVTVSSASLPAETTTTSPETKSFRALDGKVSTMAVTTSSTTGTQACSTTGVQNTAVLLVTFPGVTLPSNITPQNVSDMFFSPTGQSLDGFWREASYGQTSAAGNVFGPYTLDSSYNNCLRLDLLRDAAVAAATNAGANFQNYQRIFIVLPDMCGWTGLALSGCTSLNSPIGPYTASTAFLNGRWQRSQGEGAQNASHEGGHSLGLAHAQSRDFGTEALGPLGAAGTVGEYGDNFSAMGMDAYPFNFGHYAASQKAEVLNWLASGTSYQVVQTSGAWTLSPYETSQPGLKALKIQRGTGNNAWVWIEYRQPTGNYDPNLCSAACQPFSGALVHYEDSTTGAYSHLLDFTPTTDSFDDPALVAGQTWVDPYTNLSITVQSATASGLTVIVNYGATPCTHANPSVSVSPPNPSVPAGSSVSYTATITNNDSSGCAAGAFNLSSDQPNNWPGTFSASSVSINPGQQGTVTMTKTVPAGTLPGTYAVDTTATSALSGSTGTGNANSTVLAASTLSVNLTVAASTYAKGQTASITATVLNGVTPVAGASVTFTMTKADGTKSTKTVTTDSTGKAVWSYKVAPKDPKGPYSVTSQANYSSLTATSNPVTFTVQ